LKSRFSFLDFFMPTFAVILCVSNVVAQKFLDVTFLGVTWSVDVGTLLLFPALYVLNDVIIEVYGYATTRRVIWTAFVLQILAAALFSLAVAMPASPYFDGQEAFARVLGAVPALVVASLVGYWAGSFSNSFVMSRMKEWMVKWDPEHKWLPLRTIGSTIVGEFVDTALFVTIGMFAGLFPKEVFIMLIISQWILKTFVEIILTPATVWVIKKVKKAEGMDVVGTETYNPFALKKGK
jgi:uncharacterized integral membrane protein (TIGR00697 family)